MTASLLAVELRHNRAAAISRARRALKRAGSVSGAARLLGVSVRTAQNWAQPGRPDCIPAFAALVDELNLRRSDPRAKAG